MANYNMIVPSMEYGGYVCSGGGGGFAWLSKFDGNMDNIWDAVYDYGPNGENFLSCDTTENGGIVGAGKTHSIAPSAYSDIYAARVDRFGDDFESITESEVAISKPTDVDITAYPNPFNSMVDIKIKAPKLIGKSYEVGIYDLEGRPIKSYKLHGSGSITWSPASEIPTGIYSVVFRSKEYKTCKRIFYIK
jgi:hypothetical protein